MTAKQLLQSAGDGSTVPTSYVGEVLTFTSRSVAGGAGTWAANSSALTTLTPGVWLIYGDATLSTSGTAQAVRISTSTTAGAGNISQFVGVQNATLNVEGQMPVVVYQATTSTPLYMQCLNASGSASGTVAGIAVRIG